MAIARAVLWGQKIVLLDEPAAALGVKQTEIVLQFVERLKRQSVGVIFISHNMQHVLRVADGSIVTRLGEKVYDGAKGSATATTISWDDHRGALDRRPGMTSIRRSIARARRLRARRLRCRPR